MKFIRKKAAELAGAILFFSAICVGATLPTTTLGPVRFCAVAILSKVSLFCVCACVCACLCLCLCCACVCVSACVCVCVRQTNF